METKLSCRACGDVVCTLDEAKALVQRDYTYTDAEIDDPFFILHVWHPACAVADGKTDSIDDLAQGAPSDAFYYAARPG